MHVSDAVEYFFEDYLDLVLIDLIIFAHNVFLEVVVVEVEHDLELLIFGFVADIDERYDVRVLL